MAIPIEHLTHDQPPLVTISPDATLQTAVALMIEHDFSQLPVIENGKPYGKPASFVTCKSIARALLNFGAPLQELRVRDAIDSARTISADEDLFSKMDDLLDAYAVLVLNPDGTLAGIVTNYDTTQYFRRRAEDMLLVEDIETTLKDHVRVAYKGDENNANGPLQTAINALNTPVDSIRDNCRKAFRKFCSSKSIAIIESDIVDVVDKTFAGTKGDRKFDDLTLSEYIQLAKRPEAWLFLELIFGVSSKAFLEMIEGVRKTRNKLMHFRPDIEPVERDRLRFCAEWFKNHPPLTLEDDPIEVGRQLQGQLSVGGDTIPTEEDIEYIEEDTPYEDNVALAENKQVESKYAPLAYHLLKQPQSQSRLTLTFDEIEKIITASLPATAREHRAWWANDSTAHVQSKQWLKVNWRVVSINMTEEKVTFARARDREQAYINFFSGVQNRLRETPDFPLHKANPLGINWLALAYFPSSRQRINLSFTHHQRLRLEFYIDTSNGDENKCIFDALVGHRAIIESRMERPLEWERLENRRASRIALYTEGSINDEPEKIEELSDWAVENAMRLYQAIREPLQTVLQSLNPIS